MTRTELRRTREQLIAQQRRLQANLAGMADEALRLGHGPASSNHSKLPSPAGDAGTDPSEREVSLLLLENEELVLAQIRDAISRIDSGRFGQCDDCGRAISAARLQAIPYTALCIDCANRRDNA